MAEGSFSFQVPLGCRVYCLLTSWAFLTTLVLSGSVQRRCTYRGLIPRRNDLAVFFNKESEQLHFFYMHIHVGTKSCDLLDGHGGIIGLSRSRMVVCLCSGPDDGPERLPSHCMTAVENGPSDPPVRITSVPFLLTSCRWSRAACTV